MSLSVRSELQSAQVTAAGRAADGTDPATDDDVADRTAVGTEPGADDAAETARCADPEPSDLTEAEVDDEAAEADMDVFLFWRRFLDNFVLIMSEEDEEEELVILSLLPEAA